MARVGSGWCRRLNYLWVGSRFELATGGVGPELVMVGVVSGGVGSHLVMVGVDV